MRILLITFLATLVAACSTFEEQADFSLADPVEDIALKGFRQYHSFDRKPVGKCVEHTIWVITKLEKQGIPYELVMLEVTEGLWHSIVKVGDKAIDINFAEPYPYSEYESHYKIVKNYRQVSAKNTPELLALLGYSWRKNSGSTMLY